MRRKFSLILVGVVAFTFVGLAQQDSVHRFTLREAQEFAIVNNTDIKNARLDIASAKKKVWETTAIGLPHVDGALNHTHIPGEIPEIDLDFTSGLVALIAPLYEEHDIELPDLGGGEEGGAPIAVKNSTTYSATVSQLVFSGEYIVGLQASKTFLQLSQNSYERTVLDIKETVALNYVSVLLLDESIITIKASLDNFSQTLSEMKALNENGFIEETDVDQIQLVVNTLENTLKTLERNKTISEQLFKIAVGLDINDKVELKENFDNVVISLNVMEEPKLAFNLLENIDYKTIKTAEKINELSLKREQSAYLPSVFAFYNYQDKTEKADFDFTLNHMIGVNVDIPIFSSGARNSRVQQAKIELEKSRNSSKLVEESLKMQSDLTFLNYLNAKEKYEVEKTNIELSEKIYDRTKLKFQEGISSSLELTQANDQYLNAVSSYTQAIAELITAKLAYNKLTNNL